MLVQSASWAEDSVAVRRHWEVGMTGRAVAFGPVLHSDDLGHERDVSDIEQWFVDQEAIGLVHLDQDAGWAIL